MLTVAVDFIDTFYANEPQLRICKQTLVNNTGVQGIYFLIKDTR